MAFAGAWTEAAYAPNGVADRRETGAWARGLLHMDADEIAAESERAPQTMTSCNYT